MNASIITIGDELLIGQVLDSNSAFIARELNKAGIKIHRMLSVPDIAGEIKQSLDDVASQVDLVLITGGLGPTSDDITKPALAEYFGSKLVFFPEAYKHISTFLERRRVKITERNKKQAELPDNCRMMPNMNGTASGMWFEKNGRVYVSMPGVPYEMEEMLKNYVIPWLRPRLGNHAIIHHTILTVGIPESVMAEKIAAWERALPTQIRLAYLPSPGILRLRLTSDSVDSGLMTQQIAGYTEKLKTILGDTIFGYNDDTLEAVTGRLLAAKGASLAVTESCTGGNISRMITSVPGSSDYYLGGVIAYSNEVKTSMLDVNPSDLIKFGAVSRQVVEQMAEGARRLFNSDFSVATSGIAGPAGGTAEKPVGTIWISVTSAYRTTSMLFHFGDVRERNIMRASIAALNMLRTAISEGL